MSTKKERKLTGMRARRKKKGARIVLFSFIAALLIGVAVFLFVTLSDVLNPPGSQDGASAKREKIKTTLYFSDYNERFLAPEARYLPKEKSTQSQALQIVKALIEGPKTDLVRTFPENTSLLNLRVDREGTAYVNFGADLISSHPGGSAGEMATIYSLADTLILNLPEIKKVKILVDGKDRETLKGHISLTLPFTLNREILTQSPQG